MATCLGDKLGWMSRKYFSLFPIHSAMTSLSAVMSHAHASLRARLTGARSPPDIKQNKCKDVDNSSIARGLHLLGLGRGMAAGGSPTRFSDSWGKGIHPDHWCFFMFEWTCPTPQFLELCCPLTVHDLNHSQFHSHTLGRRSPCYLFLSPRPCLSSVEPSGFPSSYDCIFKDFYISCLVASVHLQI